MQEYKYSGYRVKPFPEPRVIDGVKYSYYTTLKDTPIPFTSLADARRWCKQNYLTGVFHGWIEP